MIHRIVGFVVLPGVLLLSLVLLWRSAEPPVNPKIVAAHEALGARKFKLAEQLAREALAAEHSVPATLIAGEAALRDGRPDRAMGYYRQLPADNSAASLEALLEAARQLKEEGSLTLTEEILRQLLPRHPNSADVLSQLVFVLRTSGRRWEATPFLFELLKQENLQAWDLLALAEYDLAPLDQSRYLYKCRAASPEDPLPILGLARRHLDRREPELAFPLARQVVQIQPALVEGQARWGQLLLDAGETMSLEEWHATLPNSANSHPEIWAVRGTWANGLGDQRGALRCYLEAAAIEPNHLLATTRAAQLMISLGHRDEATPLLKRATDLQQLADRLGHLQDHVGYLRHDEAPVVHEVARLLLQLGRPWEARAWARTAVQLDPNVKGASEIVEDLNELRTETPRTNFSVSKRIDIANYPLPKFMTEGSPLELPKAEQSSTPVQFQDMAASAGLDFEYFNSPDPSTEGMRMLEFTGGGVGIIDYDLDGWPDIYLTQGCLWPYEPSNKTYADQLFRNTGNGRFVNVTAQAALGDLHFSQGCAIGDYDNDGWPDIYVANIGRNVLYHNNGDGSFTDATDDAGIIGDDWTTSCAMADLDGDRHPELFDVNYVTGSNVFTLICQGEDGSSRSCHPTVFEAAQDRLYRNLGNGSFQDISLEAGIIAPNGLGLGIVIGRFGPSDGAAAFVANDARANFLFVNESKPGSALKLKEVGFLAGVALDRDGQAQACMGIAAGDANEDGILDLFVTNFFNESNTLYLQQPGGVFSDGTAPAGLREPSMQKLGFGTQFIDGELDGLLDLVITNGDVDDFRTIGRPYHQPPQYMRNTGGGRYVELPATELGKFFQGEYLGRGLARVDWNRDGREDFVVSHLEAPVALVTNQTQTPHHYLAIQLRGTVSSRDAIGATVRVSTSHGKWTSQLTAGDGYMASNQRQLVFGLAAAKEIDQLTIRWPSGTEETFQGLAVDQELLFIEGSPQPYRLPR